MDSNCLNPYFYRNIYFANNNISYLKMYIFSKAFIIISKKLIKNIFNRIILINIINYDISTKRLFVYMDIVM